MASKIEVGDTVEIFPGYDKPLRGEVINIFGYFGYNHYVIDLEKGGYLKEEQHRASAMEYRERYWVSFIVAVKSNLKKVQQNET